MFTDMEVFFFTVMHLGGPKVRYLPEIMNLLGSELAGDFLEVFAGKTIRIPNREDLRLISQKFMCWQMVRNGYSDEALANYARSIGRKKCFVTNACTTVDRVFKEMLQGVEDAKAKKSNSGGK